MRSSELLENPSLLLFRLLQLRVALGIYLSRVMAAWPKITQVLSSSENMVSVLWGLWWCNWPTVMDIRRRIVLVTRMRRMTVHRWLEWNDIVAWIMTNEWMWKASAVMIRRWCWCAWSKAVSSISKAIVSHVHVVEH